jgi:L-ascorbate metabolism protein UlaG (beta-lactamase superfamily)
MENMNICFLGALDNEKSISSEMLEAMEEDVDILFVPVGGEGVLNADLAYKLAVKLEPKLIIPMHYGEVGEKEALKKFLKEAGEDIKPIDKLTLKKKDLEGKEGEIVVLSQV